MTIPHHYHRCPACRTVWRHADTCWSDLAAHQCPECGAEQWNPCEPGAADVAALAGQDVPPCRKPGDCWTLAEEDA